MNDHTKKIFKKLQKEYRRNGGSIVITIYEEGSQHIERIDHYYAGSKLDPPKIIDHSELPAALNTEKAKVLWKKAQDVGWVDENYQPKLSRTQAALLASEMAKRLSVREKWKLFGAFWHQNKMYKYYYQAMNQKQTLDFLDEIKKLFD